MNISPVWKSIKNFPHYEVNQFGQVRSWRRKSRTWRNPHSDRSDTPKTLRGTRTDLGYVAYILRTPDGIIKRFMAHRLVAFAFIGDPGSGQTDVCHNDGDPSNNHVDNLRWDTHFNNQMDMRKHGTMQDGQKSITAKISAKDAEIIKERAKKRGEGRKLAKEFGLSFAQISRIKNGKRWRILPE